MTNYNPQYAAQQVSKMPKAKYMGNARRAADDAAAACNRAQGMRERAADAQQARQPEQAQRAAQLARACAEEAQTAADIAAEILKAAFDNTWQLEEYADRADDAARLARHHATYAEESARIASLIGPRGEQITPEQRAARSGAYVQMLVDDFAQEMAAAVAELESAGLWESVAAPEAPEEEEIHTQEINRAGDAISNAARALVSLSQIVARTAPEHSAAMQARYMDALADNQRANEALQRATIAAWRGDIASQTSQSLAAQSYAARVTNALVEALAEEENR